ncbi:MAG: heme-binding domain-containing protein [Myxococcota bacterium]
MSRVSAILFVTPLFASACGLPDNPPVTQEIQWVDAETEALARRACYDCHSNETHWKGSHRWPIVNSLVRSDVKRARCVMNLSEWDGPNEEAWEASDALIDGEMPLGLYKSSHPDARLTDDEIVRLAEGFEATFAIDPPLPGERCDD